MTLIAFNYIGNERTTILTTRDLLKRIGDQVAAQVTGLLAPVQSVVNISSKTISTVGRSFDERLELLEYFVEILRFSFNRQISSMYVSDVDGDFFIVRSVQNNPEAAKAFGAPEGTHFVVQGIDRELDELVSEQILFLDEKLFLLGTETKETTVYDHRMRSWFKAAVYNHDLITTEYYVLFATREIGLTVARRLREGLGVVAADLTLHDISAKLGNQRVTPTTELILLDSELTITCPFGLRQNRGPFEPHRPVKKIRMPHLRNFENPPLFPIIGHYNASITRAAVRFAGMEKRRRRTFWPTWKAIPIDKGRDLFLTSLIPRDELLSDLKRLKNQSILISVTLLAGTILLVFWLAQRMSKSLRVLAGEARDIRAFKLDTPISVQSRILEVNHLAETMAVMKSSIQQFLSISKALSGEKNFDRLLEMILREAKGVARADAGAISLRSEDDSRLELAVLQNDRTGVHLGGTSDVAVPFEPVPLPMQGRSPGQTRGAVPHPLLTGSVVQVENMDADHRFDYSELRTWFEQDGYRCRALLIVPLVNQKGEFIGTLQLVNSQEKHRGDGRFQL